MSTNPYLSIDQQMVGDIYTSPEAMDNLTVLCDDFGSRFGGTPGERLAADFIAAKLTEYGLQNVALEPLEYLGWHRGEVSLEMVAPVDMSLSCITLPHSPPADLEAPVIDLGDGAPADFEKHADEIPGKIVMVNSKTAPRGMSRWVHRNEKYGRSIMAGAAGFIFVNHYPAYGPATGGVGDNGQGPIPAISLAYEDGAFLQRTMKRKGDVVLRIKSTDSFEELVSWNIVGELPGTSENPELVMLGCHVDGHDISQGAHDPASGAVAVMEAARVLKKYGGPLTHTVRVALWGVEEIGLIGSTTYVEEHADELDKIRFYFNMDGAGGKGRKDVVLNEWPDLEPIFEGWSEEMVLDCAVGESVSAHSDHFPFLMEGVPTAGMGAAVRENTGRGYGHTKYDTLDKIELVGLREAAALAARLALRMANAPVWPVSRRSKADVAALFDQPDYQAEAEYRAQYEAFRKENRLG
jgi:aminopeptidase YwaD